MFLVGFLQTLQKQNKIKPRMANPPKAIIIAMRTPSIDPPNLFQNDFLDSIVGATE
jgi:hypothetical protein